MATIDLSIEGTAVDSGGYRCREGAVVGIPSSMTRELSTDGDRFAGSNDADGVMVGSNDEVSSLIIEGESVVGTNG